jgi:hypothetical protein
MSLPTVILMYYEDHEGQRATTLKEAVSISQRIPDRMEMQPPLLDSTHSTSNGSIPDHSQSPSANSWKGYRMIDVESETSCDSVALAQWGLSPEAELDL